VPGAFDRDSPREEGHFAGTRRNMTNQKLCQSALAVYSIDKSGNFVATRSGWIAPHKPPLKTATAPPAK
jgi:hypothetical protein